MNSKTPDFVEEEGEVGTLGDSQETKLCTGVLIEC